MAKYKLHLKGYVGASDFNTRDVDKCLRENEDNDVAVLIDSTGGSLATGLSIAAAFRNHGAVDVHFVGLNASAATVASLGARTVTIDRGAMYLVHKCSNVVFAWESMNADELADYIDRLTKNKEDLDKIDNNVAALYAARCRKDPADLLELMKKGGWLSPKEALEWGFVDKITDFETDERARVTAALAEDLKAAGIPVPGKVEKEGKGLASIFTALRDFMSSGKQTVPVAGASDTGASVPQDPEAGSSGESSQVETAGNAGEENTQTTAAAIPNVIEASVKPPKNQDASSALSSFISTNVSARELFNSLP